MPCSKTVENPSCPAEAVAQVPNLWDFGESCAPLSEPGALGWRSQGHGWWSRVELTRTWPLAASQQ